MRINIMPLLRWLGYSRRERRSSFVLLIILAIVILMSRIIPSKELRIEDLSASLAKAGGLDPVVSAPGGSFRFDPNSSSFDTLVQAGFTERQVKTLLSYRNKGGRFRKPEDVERIYGIDQQTMSRIRPLIEIRNKQDGQSRLPGERGKQRKPAGRLDLNNCDSAALDALPGIGPVLSSRIIKYRKLLGGFASAGQLKEVYGLPDSTFNILEDRVFADTSGIVRISVNDVGRRDFSRHPYLTRSEIDAIFAYKKLKGPVTGTAELVANKVLTAEKAKKISPYLKF